MRHDQGPARQLSGRAILGEILILDDDPGVCSVVSQGLHREGYGVTKAGSGREAAHLLDDLHQSYDLVLLDIGLPDTSGWEFLRARRAAGDTTPVVFISAQHEVPDRVRGLRLGADDFLQKPFRLEELAARIDAIMRRRDSIPVFRSGPLLIDLGHQEARVGLRLVDCSPREFQVLSVLARARGQIVSRAELLREVWGLPSDPGTKLLEVQITRLRRKLLPEGKGLIRTVVGRGYCLSPPGAGSSAQMLRETRAAQRSPGIP